MCDILEGRVRQTGPPIARLCYNFCNLWISEESF